MKNTLEVCDNCLDRERPTARHSVSMDGDSAVVDLCPQCAGIVASLVNKGRSADARRRPRHPIVVTDIADIETRKKLTKKSPRT